MAAHETRMLLLGAVAMFQPVNGYQIRRELVSWEVDRWAHVKPGSIYHGLAALTGQGHLVRHDLVDGTRDVAVYETTEAGDAELQRLLRSALETVDPYDSVAFHAAFSMLPLAEPEQVVASLEVRRRALEETADRFPVVRDPAAAPAPPHAMRSLLLWRDCVLTELAWLRQVLHDIEAGTFRFGLGDDWGWQPPADDPGWQMQADQERYRALLGR